MYTKQESPEEEQVWKELVDLRNVWDTQVVSKPRPTSCHGRRKRKEERRGELAGATLNTKRANPSKQLSEVPDVAKISRKKDEKRPTSRYDSEKVMRTSQ